MLVCHFFVAFKKIWYLEVKSNLTYVTYYYANNKGVVANCLNYIFLQNYNLKQT